jgi:uncharacterized membrane protein YedE/YeeE
LALVVFWNYNFSHYVFPHLFWAVFWLFIKPKNHLCGCRTGQNKQFFDFNWRAQIWNIVFLIGAVIGGFIGGNLMSTGEPVKISDATKADLANYGFAEPTSIQPSELFSWDALFTLKGFLIMALGGLMVGFGARYAGGCTSGHAISGLSDLQWPSLIAVIGFFVGGLIMTFLIFPFIF